MPGEKTSKSTARLDVDAKKPPARAREFQPIQSIQESGSRAAEEIGEGSRAGSARGGRRAAMPVLASTLVLVAAPLVAALLHLPLLAVPPTIYRGELAVPPALSSGGGHFFSSSDDRFHCIRHSLPELSVLHESYGTLRARVKTDDNAVVAAAVVPAAARVTGERPLADSTISDDAARDSTPGALEATDADNSELGGGSTTHADDSDTAADDGFRLVKFSASNAVCLDGSAGGYYYYNGTEPGVIVHMVSI